jgi:hypothetical protein
LAKFFPEFLELDQWFSTFFCSRNPKEDKENLHITQEDVRGHFLSCQDSIKQRFPTFFCSRTPQEEEENSRTA